MTATIPPSISGDCLDALVASALRMIAELGMDVRRPDLLERIRGQEGLAVRGSRVTISEATGRETLAAMRRAHASPDAAHGGGAATGRDGPIVRITSRPMSIADHRVHRLRPLTRGDVIHGTKLVDALSRQPGVYGTTCGTPQDAPLPLQPLEQYIIGYRYSRHGGWTDIPLDPEVAGVMEAVREIAEEDYDPRRRAFAIWEPSPLRLDSTELHELLAFDGQVVRITVGSMPTMGLNGPVDPLGVYSLSVAESLGGAAILHRLYPEAELSILPHPQPMDLHTGNMIFGSVEWNRLDLLKKQILGHLGIPYRRKECLTSACMPDARAQADKVASVTFGVLHGFDQFGMYPLCADEVWSDVQCVLDVEYVHDAWRTLKPEADPAPAQDAYETMARALAEGTLPAEMEESVARLRQHYAPGPFRRYSTVALWDEAGRPDLLDEVAAYAEELVRQADYAPDDDRLRAILGHYERLCRRFGAEPMRLD